MSKSKDNILLRIRGKAGYIRSILLFYLFRLIPNKNKVVATTFEGRKYGDNPQFILEALHEISPETDIVWVKKDEFDYKVPEYMRTVSFNSRIKKIYEYATAKVWIDTHRLATFMRKSKDQLFIETWHGGLGIKKLDGDVPKFRNEKWLMKQVHHTSKLADIFISNSKHLTDIYRTAFCYTGPVWECGYPKNDVMFTDPNLARNMVCQYYNIPYDSKLMVYGPTFRDNFRENGVDFNVYDIDFKRLYEALSKKFKGEWYILVKFHPFILKQQGIENVGGDHIINATGYPDMQKLILGCDAFISDYSSCIFDAAMTGIPCFTFAKDFDDYKGDRGVYYEMEELPFPYARNNDELINNIESFDSDDYNAKWKAFAERTGLHETGHASKDIAEKIVQFINGEDVKWTD